MIENYLYTIGVYLSPKTRQEILKEVEINLYDFLEQNFGEKDYSDQEIETAIRAMGHPRNVAEAYMPYPRTLIGPALIDTYWLVLKIALVSIALGLTAASLIDLTNVKGVVELFVGIATNIWNTSLSVVGMITIIFAVIQFYNPTESTQKEKEWSLKDLKQAVEPEQSIKNFDIATESFFMALALIGLNQWLPMHFDGATLPVMTGKVLLIPYVMAIKGLIIAGLLLNIYLLIHQSWQTFSRILSIVMDVSAVLLFTHLVLNPGIWKFLIQFSSSGFNSSKLETVIRLSVNIGLAVFVIVVGFSVYGHLKAIWASRNKDGKG